MNSKFSLSLLLMMMIAATISAQCTGAVNNTSFNATYSGSAVGQSWSADCNGTLNTIEIQSNSILASIGNITLEIWEQVGVNPATVTYTQTGVTINGQGNPTTITVNGGTGSKGITSGNIYFFILTQNDATDLEMHYQSVGSYIGGDAVDGSRNIIGVSADLKFDIDATVNVPVELTSFDASTTNDGVLLSWQTVSEIDNLGFDILKSPNGKTWEKIGHIAGAYNSIEINNYEFLDAQPFDGYTYYKLKQIDTDGSFEYSQVISTFKKSNTAAVSIYPNPVVDILNIEFDTEKERAIKLYHTTGQLIFNKKIETATTVTISIKNYQLSSGMYLLYIEEGERLIDIRQIIID